MFSHSEALKCLNAITHPIITAEVKAQIDAHPRTHIVIEGAVLYATDGNDVYYYEALASWLKERFDIKPLLDVDDGIITSSRTKDCFW